MDQSFLVIINYSCILLFGVFVSAAFLGITNKKSILILLLSCIVIGGMQIFSFVCIGFNQTMKIYPLITHLPLFLVFVLYFKRNPLSTLFSIFSAYLCCQISNWFSVLFGVITGKKWVSYCVQIIVTIIIGYILIYILSNSISLILHKSRKVILIIGILPATYYIYDYISTVYTDLLYKGSAIIFEFLPFIFCISFLLFCVIYFQEYEQKCEIAQKNQLLEIQKTQSIKEIESIRRSEYEITLLRHDMRHFLTNLSSTIVNKDWKNAQSYIDKLIETVNNNSITKYCENETINMILSYYENKMQENSIQFNATVKIPAVLSFSEIDFTSILSNGLENALHATLNVAPEKKVISLDLQMKDNKLLLSIKNPYKDTPKFVDGLPISEVVGHGLGTQSIRYVTEKMNGNCQFSLQDSSFILRVVL